MVLKTCVGRNLVCWLDLIKIKADDKLVNIEHEQLRVCTEAVTSIGDKPFPTKTLG